MRIPRKIHFLVLALLAAVTITKAEEEDLDDVGFDDFEEETSEKLSTSLNVEGGFFEKKEMEIRSAVSAAVKIPEKQAQLTEVLPIIRSMSPPQKRAMAVLVTTRMSHNDTSLPFDKVESLFGADDNNNVTRDLMLPISMDIAKIIADDMPEELPEAQELRYFLPGKRRRPLYQAPPRRLSMIRRNVHPDGPRPFIRPGRRPSEVKRSPTEQECNFFSPTVCLEAMDYPHEAIMRSIRGNREMITALLADYKSQNTAEYQDDTLPVALPLENKYENRFESNEIKRRSDNNSPYAENIEEGFTCPSQVRYARPQLARAASGAWKYIINTGEHTQTLRLEKCTKPQSSCSFVSENYKSSCTQVFNYHRLLTWDTSLGLHMDIFKVPTCCSCHVLGYSDIYPPHRKNPPSKLKENFPGADFITEDQPENYREYNKPSNFVTKQSPGVNFDQSFLNAGSSSSYDDVATGNSNYKYFEKKPSSDLQSNRPTFTPTVRARPKKKPGTSSRPFDNVPPQHAPNTRAPGYSGPLSKSRTRPNRPFRRESNSQLDYPNSAADSETNENRYSQQIDQDVDATTRVQTGTFDDEYQDPPRRVNYNYHPIIDFFKPEASMLQSVEPQMATQPAPVQSSNAWKPMISP